MSDRNRRQDLMNMVQVRGLRKSFGKLEVLKGVDLDLEKGQIKSVIGPSGSGKSTLLRCMIHLERANGGSILIEGEPIVDELEGVMHHPSEHLIRHRCRKLGMVFQNFNLFPHKTALENVMEAPIVVTKLSRAEAVAKAEVLLAKVGLADKRDTYPCHLSGGQKQRVAIARALAMDPDIMLFDEPTSALDPELIGEVLGVIKDLASEHMTMCIVTHEMTFAREVSDTVVFMDDGRVLEEAPPERLFTCPDHPRIRSFLDKML